MTRSTFLILFLALAGFNILNAQALTVSVTPSVCFDPNTPSSNTVAANVTTTVSGITAYSWSVFPSTGSTSCNGTYTTTNSTGTAITASFPCSGWYVVSVSAFNGTAYVGYGSATVTVGGPQSLNVAQNNYVCTGSTVALTAWGGSSHSWSDGNSVIGTGSSVVVSPTANTCYTVTGVAFSGCTVSAVTCVSVTPSPTITANIVYSSTTHCLYSGITLTATGASSYTWMTNNNYVISNNNPASWYLQNTAPCYTVFGSNGGCVASAVVCATAQPAVPLTITVSPSPTICIGSTATLSTSGASNYSWTSYWQNMNSTSPTVAVTPTITGFSGYTVSATDPFGCYTWTHVGITTISGPSVGISGSPTICPGQTRTLTVFGPGPYSWFDGTSTISTASSVVVSPTVTTCYTVTNGFTGCNSGVRCIYVTSNPAITLTGGQSCSSWGLQLYAQGGSYYSWSVGTASTNVIWVTPQVNTCYTVTGYLNAGCSGTAATCVTVIPAPSYTGSQSGYTVCAGTTITLATMPNVYNYWVNSTTTWTNFSSGTGTAVVMTPTISGTYSVNISSTNTNVPYCPTTFTTNITVVQPPTIMIAGSGTVCQGSSINLQAFGASSYTWNTNANTALINVSPSSNTCYTVTGSSLPGCQSSAVKCVTVISVPVVTIAGNNTICMGSSISLTASGANTYLWSNNATGSSINVNPTTNTCYTVIGSAQGCTNSASHCVSPQAANIGASPSSATVCKGTSADFTATGGVTYTWSTGPTTSTVNILPTASGSYTVWGTSANGCDGSYVVSIVVDTTCTDVWPGDANSDGVVGTTDVLEIGLAYLNTGPSRNNASNNYVAQEADLWSGTVSSGKNQAHADCDGNGTVSLSDTLAIFNNFALTHSFRSSSSHAQFADVSLVSNDHNLLNAGIWNKLDITLGDETNLFSVYGVAFDLAFDQSLVEEAYIVFTSSFLNNGNQQVEFRKPFFNNGKIYCASVRTDGTDMDGAGKIAEFHFRAKSDLAENTVMNVTINNAARITANSQMANLSGNQVQLTMNSNPVTVRENFANVRSGLYPNPAMDRVVLYSDVTQKTNFSITDVTGRLIRKGEFVKSTELSTSDLQSGTYFVTLDNGNHVKTEKLVIHR
jgi:hypothetical protein